MNKDRKKSIYSDSSIPDPAAATFFPLSPSPGQREADRREPGLPQG